MIKKGHIIAVIAIVTILLGSLLYVDITMAQKGKQPTQVEVINLPTDEQGNLRVTHEPSWKVINVVENLNLTWTPELSSVEVYSDLIDLGSVLVGGYSRMKVYMRVTNFTWLYQGSPNRALVNCYLASLYDYGEVQRNTLQVQWHWNTPAQALFAELPQYPGAMRETEEPSLKITVIGGSNTPNGPVLPAISCLVSVGIYLRNE